jgi:7-cyano-7-deazaguanine synthase
MDLSHKYKTVVILSGGMDSAICLALAVKKFGAPSVIAITFDYGQRHRVELKQAKIITKFFKVMHKIVKINIFKQISTSSLLNKNLKIKRNKKGTPNSMVTGRNGLFAATGAMIAHEVGANSLWMGVMGLEAANSGYPDCSPHYMKLVEKIIRLDLQNPRFKVYTPLINETKKSSMTMANRLGVLNFLWHNTISCYEGKMGRGCEKCPACKLRNEGMDSFLSSSNFKLT